MNHDETPWIALTVYHGHSKKTFRGSNSWTVNRDIADWFGRRNAYILKRTGEPCNNYWLATGKVKLADVLALITGRNEDEIVVLNKHVIKVAKQEYPFALEQTRDRPKPMFSSEEK
jgi:hypothetical protein